MQLQIKNSIYLAVDRFESAIRLRIVIRKDEELDEVFFSEADHDFNRAISAFTLCKSYVRVT